MHTALGNLSNESFVLGHKFLSQLINKIELQIPLHVLLVDVLNVV